MNEPSKLRLGTRGSKLALVQAHTVRGLLMAAYPGLEVEIVTVTTSGDRGEREVLGAFVREIQYALLENRVDVALHCLKDLPTQAVPGLKLAAYLEREDARDALIGSVTRVADLSQGAVVGTGSVRRTSQLAAVRPDLVFQPLVGNVDTRMRKLNAGEYDAIILAIAGLNRLGAEGIDLGAMRVTALTEDEMLPCPGQAILVLETREAEVERVNRLDHSASRSSGIAERLMLSRFGGGCSVPVAAFAAIEEGVLNLRGLVASPDGSRVVRGKASAATPEAVADLVFEQLASQGACELFTPREAGL